MKDSLTRTIKSVSRIPKITVTVKRTFTISTSGFVMTRVTQTFINVYKRNVKITKTKSIEKATEKHRHTNVEFTY
jgi:hypothetical protein